jgi:hypothetical protein
VAALLLGSFLGARAESDRPFERIAEWQARDSQAGWFFNDPKWIGGGRFQSHAEPPRDVWASRDGKTWSLVQADAPWLHSDLPISQI